MHLGGIHTMKSKVDFPSFPLQQHGWAWRVLCQGKSVSQRQVPYDFTYRWNLTNKRNKQKKNRLIETENRLSAVRGAEVGGLGEEGEEIKQNKQTNSQTQTTAW